MCGIVGIVERDLTRPVAEIDVQRMVRTLNHRGPDDEGSVLLPGVGLAMRRLAIVDIAGGQQPFAVLPHPLDASDYAVGKECQTPHE